MPRPKVAVANDALRGILTARGVAPTYTDDTGTRRWLKKPEMGALLASLEKKRDADVLYAGEGKCPSRVFHCFWSSPAPCSWGAAARVPPGCALGALSASQLGYEVHIWTYHTALKGLPDATPCGPILVQNAGELWPAQAAATHLAENIWQIQHVADYVRLLACARRTSSVPPASLQRLRKSASAHALGGSGLAASASADIGAPIEVQAGAWFADLDNVWLNPRRYLPSKSGHLFALMPGTIAPWFGLDEHHYLCNWIGFPGQQAFFSTPDYYPAGSAVLSSIIAGVQARWLKSAKNHYNWVMYLMRDEVCKAGLHLDYVPHAEFNPVGATAQHQGVLFKARARVRLEFPAIAASATCLCQYWCSTKPVLASTKGEISIETVFIYLFKNWFCFICFCFLIYF